jgi:hypothetical protein
MRRVDVLLLWLGISGSFGYGAESMDLTLTAGKKIPGSEMWETRIQIGPFSMEWASQIGCRKLWLRNREDRVIKWNRELQTRSAKEGIRFSVLSIMRAHTQRVEAILSDLYDLIGTSQEKKQAAYQSLYGHTCMAQLWEEWQEYQYNNLRGVEKIRGSILYFLLTRVEEGHGSEERLSRLNVIQDLIPYIQWEGLLISLDFSDAIWEQMLSAFSAEKKMQRETGAVTSDHVPSPRRQQIFHLFVEKKGAVSQAEEACLQEISSKVRF